VTTVPRREQCERLRREDLRSILEEETAIELQHVNVKLLLRHLDQINLDLVIPIFHSWIQDQIYDELLLDVADYRHVHHGPGLMLIGHDADYSIDNTDGLLGIRYNRKTPLAGTNVDRLIQATRSALLACRRLEADTRLDGKLQFNGHDLQLIINDRLLAPNNEPTRQLIAPHVQSFAGKLFSQSAFSENDEEPGEKRYSFSYSTDPRRLLSASISSSKPFSTGDLLKNLAF
jgi:hypothetical protein